MEHTFTVLCAVSFLFTISTVSTSTPGARDDTNAQAIGSSSSSSGSESGLDDDNYVQLVRRFVPRFIGKREPENEQIEKNEHIEKLLDINVDSIEDFVDDMLNYYDDMDLDDEVISIKEKEKDMSKLENFKEDIDDDVVVKESQQYNPQEEKRYIPSFVGKRLDSDASDTFAEDKRYQPRFVGKRYRPMFVGKRYQPRFVGKRYQPRFVGKRYTPRFVGKRYTPRFVGKRYTPRFIGKRFKPIFVGKRYRPIFIGKRDVSDATEETKSLEKRSVPDQIEKEDNKLPASESKHRQKRSALTDDEEIKRAWGNPPWRRLPMYLSTDNSFQNLDKRFVAPEFIGRRDSLSTILSALDALEYSRNTPRSTSKRFEAPLFVGKRAPYRPMFVGKKSSGYTFEMETPTGYEHYEVSPGISDLSLKGYEKMADDSRLDPDEVLTSYSLPLYDAFHYRSSLDEE